MTRGRTSSQRIDVSAVSDDPVYLARLVTGWAMVQQFALAQGIAVVWNSARSVDAMLVLFVQACVDGSCKIYKAVAGILAVQHRLRFRRRLPRAWNAIRRWKMHLPSRSRPPLTSPLLQLFFARSLSLAATSSGMDSVMWMICGVLWCLGFHCLLRPGELSSLLRDDVVLPSESFERDFQIVVRIAMGKTRRMMPQQFCILEDESTSQWLDWLFCDIPLGAAIWPWALRRLSYMFKTLALEFGIPQYTVGSLRSGGAVWYFKASKSLSTTVIKGRWLSEKSVLHYLTEAFGQFMRRRMPASTVECLQDLVPRATALARPPAARFAALAGPSFASYLVLARAAGRRLQDERDHAFRG